MPETPPEPEPGTKPKKKADAATVALRVEEVLRIVLDGAQLHDVMEYATGKGWGLKERQIRDYIRKANELLVERQSKSRKKVIARHLAQRQSLYARAVNAADYRTALAILADEAKLRGLYPEKDVRELVKLATEQGAKIAEMEARIRAHTLGAHPPPAEGARGPASGTGIDGSEGDGL